MSGFSSLQELRQRLTESQWEVFELFATEAHHSNDILASKLYMTPQNLAAHLRNISSTLSLAKSTRTNRQLIQVYWEARCNELSRA